MKRVFSEVYWVLGALVSAPAVISVIQHVFAFGLLPEFQSFVEFYRGIVEPLFYSLRKLLPVLSETPWVSQWFLRDDLNLIFAGPDLYALSFVGIGIFMRAVSFKQDEPHTFGTALLFSAFSLVVALLGFGLLIVFWAVLQVVFWPVDAIWPNKARSTDPKEREADDIESLLRTTASATAVAVVAFYVANQIGWQA